MTDLHSDAPRANWYSGLGGFLLNEWPYLLMLGLALFGVAYTSVSETSVYWVILTPLIGAVCVASRWSEARSNDQHVYLVVSQVLHWVAVLLAMQLMSLQVTRQISGIASALGVLTLLALGTFTAGLHIRAWKIAVVGVILGISVPAIALLQQSALMIVLVFCLIAAALTPFFWTKRKPAAMSRPFPQPRRDVPLHDDTPVDRPPPAAAAASVRPVPQPPLYEAPVSAPIPMPPPPSALAPSISVLGDDEPERKPDGPDDQRPAANVRSFSGGR
jgi:hypothetical protein